MTPTKGSIGLPVSRYGMPFFSAASAAALPTVGTIGPMMAMAPSLLIRVSTLLEATFGSLLSSRRTVLTVILVPPTSMPPAALASATAFSMAHFS